LPGFEPEERLEKAFCFPAAAIGAFEDPVLRQRRKYER
jgi:hypothetical protein